MNLLNALPPRESAVAACARALRESILRGDLSPGSALPPERELAATFGVNRLTLRAALAQLVASGLVAVRHGSGNVIREFSDVGGPDLLPTLVALARDQRQWRQVLRDMLLVRRSLAHAVVQRLVESIDAKGLARLNTAVEVFAQTALKAGATADSIALADQALVRAMLKSTSLVLALAANPIFRLVDELPELRAAMFAHPELNVAGYRALVAGLETKAPRLAEQMVETLQVLDEAMLKRLKRRTTR